MDDNGLEYCFDASKFFSNTHAIARHKTTTRTPQQGCPAERFNRTILERIRCMLLSVGLNKVFWAETDDHSLFDK